jgi:DNA processing protein
MENDLFYRLAITRVRGIGAFRTRALFNHFGEARAIFRANPATLEKIAGIGRKRAMAIVGFDGFRDIEKEMAFIEKYKIHTLFFTNAAYPQRLAIFDHAPSLLFYKGNADLNATRIISVVGTRTPTDYGKQAIADLVSQLALPDLLVVSGLAYGIDAVSHKAALRHHLSTVGVLGHGLDRIYPQEHVRLAREMAKQGGLLTEFCSGTQPDEHNFPIRNRIIAGMSDALLVVETGCRGGSMLTVENALGYGKKIFAFPGRINDHKSAGCNALIRKGKASLLTDARQLIEEMNWGASDGKPVAQQAALFRGEERPMHGKRSLNGQGSATNEPSSDRRPSSDETLSLSAEEKILLESIRQAGRISIDDLLIHEGLNRNGIPMALLNLEMTGLIRALPGKIYYPILSAKRTL